MADNRTADKARGFPEFWRDLDPNVLSIWRETTSQFRQLANEVWRGVTFFLGVNGVVLAGVFTLWTKEPRQYDSFILAGAAVLGLILTGVAYFLIRASRRHYVRVLALKTLMETELGFYDCKVSGMEVAQLHGMEKKYADNIAKNRKNWQTKHIWRGYTAKVVRIACWLAICFYAVMLVVSLSGFYSRLRSPQEKTGASAVALTESTSIWTMISAELKDTLEALSYLATIVGIPVAIAAYLSEKRKERREREREAYVEANARYIDYLTLCLDHPDLDCFDFSTHDPEVRKCGVEIKKLTLFTILICILESGYVLYRDHRTSIRSRQWQGWHDYMIMWAKRPDFRNAWPLLGPQFDTDFVQHMESIFRETEPTTTA